MKQKLEIEVKARFTDFPSLIRKLTNLGCAFSQSITQQDALFLPQGIQFKDITIQTPVLRIRQEQDKNYFTLKKGKKLAKLEKEILVNNAKELKEILELLNFHQVLQVIKTRRHCQYKGYTICLDEVEGLGSFVEVEKISAEDPALVQEEFLPKK